MSGQRCLTFNWAEVKNRKGVFSLYRQVNSGGRARINMLAHMWTVSFTSVSLSYSSIMGRSKQKSWKIWPHFSYYSQGGICQGGKLPAFLCCFISPGKNAERRRSSLVFAMGVGWWIGGRSDAYFPFLKLTMKTL